MSESPCDPLGDDLVPWIERARSGDPQALQTLFERSREPVLARIRWMMGEEARRCADSSDFLQSAFAAALPALARFEIRGNDAFLRWMTTIARNKIRQSLRQRREEAVSALSSVVAGRPSRSDGDESSLSVDTALTLMDELAKLDEKARRLIELRDLEGKSFAEIGASMGCSDRQAHRLHAQALLRLSRAFRAGPR